MCEANRGQVVWFEDGSDNGRARSEPEYPAGLRLWLLDLALVLSVAVERSIEVASV